MSNQEQKILIGLLAILSGRRMVAWELGCAEDGESDLSVMMHIDSALRKAADISWQAAQVALRDAGFEVLPPNQSDKAPDFWNVRHWDEPMLKMESFLVFWEGEDVGAVPPMVATSRPNIYSKTDLPAYLQSLELRGANNGPQMTLIDREGNYVLGSDLTWNECTGQLTEPLKKLVVPKEQFPDERSWEASCKLLEEAEFEVLRYSKEEV